MIALLIITLFGLFAIASMYASAWVEKNGKAFRVGGL